MHALPSSRAPDRPSPTRSAARALVGAAVAGWLCATPARAQQQTGDEIRGDALRVFLDCNTFPCSSDYFRTEVGFVNWVRDRTLAQVHLIITSSRTGGGGGVYDLDFIGLQELDGQDDRLTHTSLTTDTQDETLASLSRVIAVGLARYSTLIGQPGVFEIAAVGADPAAQEGLVSAEQVDDPWNFWVFEASANVDLEGEETERERQYEGSFEARRTTEAWKVELETETELSHQERELSDSSVSIDRRSNWSVDLLMAYAMADHWSLGVIAGAGASTRLNQDFGADVAVALEFSVFPYAEATRRSLTARYDLRAQYYDWEEETVFFQTEELRPQHQLRLELNQRQPWGESRVSIDGSQFLHDLGKWNVSLSGDVEVRVVRGVQLEVEGDVGFIEDQIFLSREGLTNEEILLGRFERPTNFTYELSLGLSFEFGSIYNNVVNNRFNSRNFGGFGGF